MISAGLSTALPCVGHSWRVESEKRILILSSLSCILDHSFEGKATNESPSCPFSNFQIGSPVRKVSRDEVLAERRVVHFRHIRGGPFQGRVRGGEVEPNPHEAVLH